MTSKPRLVPALDSRCFVLGPQCIVRLLFSPLLADSRSEDWFEPLSILPACKASTTESANHCRSFPRYFVLGMAAPQRPSVFTELFFEVDEKLMDGPGVRVTAAIPLSLPIVTAYTTLVYGHAWSHLTGVAYWDHGRFRDRCSPDFSVSFLSSSLSRLHLLFASKNDTLSGAFCIVSRHGFCMAFSQYIKGRLCSRWMSSAHNYTIMTRRHNVCGEPRG